MIKKIDMIGKFEVWEMENIFRGVESITIRTGGANDQNNIYVIEGDNSRAIIDPGYKDDLAKTIESQINQLHKSKPIKYILITDWYEEHWSGAQSVQEITNGIIISSQHDHGKINNDSNGQLVTKILRGGETIDLGSRKLQTINTPGHTPGSSCYLLQNEGVLFSGDCILPNTSTAIDPTEGGDMKDYLDSLRRIQMLKVDLILSFHGHPISLATERLENLIKIREDRDQQILDILQIKPTSLGGIWENIYGKRDLTGYLLEASKKQIEAHIIKLETEKEVSRLINDQGSGEDHSPIYQIINNNG